MPNTTCLTSVPFSLTGNSSFPGQDVTFQLTFDSEADQNSVKAYQWYLDGNIIIAQNLPGFEGGFGCGSHTIGARILTDDGWSGVKSLSFQTCRVNVGMDYTLDEQPQPFVDVNMQFKDQVTGGIIKDVVASGSGSFVIQSPDRFSIEVFAGATSTLPGASIYLRVKKNGIQVFEDTKPAVANPGDPDASIVFLDTPAPDDSFEVLGAGYSDPVINYTLSEQTDPFIDANLQIKNGEILLAELVASGSGSVSAAYNSPVNFTVYAGAASQAPDPVMNLTIKKNGAVITNQDGPVAPGNTLTYNETLQPGAIYEVIVTTSSE